MPDSTRFDSAGVSSVFEVRDTSTRILNSERQKATLPVRAPAIRTP